MAEGGPGILIVDDHPLFRDGLRRVALQACPGARIAEADTVAGLDAACCTAAPDLLLLDLVFPGFDAERDFADLRQRLPLTTILVVSMTDDGETVHHVMAAGANGFLSKAVAPADMAAGIGRALEGERPVLLEASSAPDPAPCALSPRQIDVLRCLARGMTNKEIGRALDISPFTVRVHVTAILRAFDVPTRSAAVSAALQAGLV